MNEWWENLEAINRIFYCLAAFFSVFFVWQLIAVLIGLGGDEVEADTDVDADVDTDVDADGTYDEFEDGAASDAVETAVAFKLVSIRSILTFCTLFTWGTALYLNRGDTLGRAMGVSIIWGVAGMFSIALLVWGMKRLTHTGTKNLASCVGTDGTVYLDIPAGGMGEVRVLVSGSISYVKARAMGGEGLKSGTPVHVERCVGQTMVLVKSIEEG